MASIRRYKTGKGEPRFEVRWRDGRGRYVKGFSGNPAGKPAGIMNEATRIAAMILTGSTTVLVYKAMSRELQRYRELLSHIYGYR